MHDSADNQHNSAVVCMGNLWYNGTEQNRRKAAEKMAIQWSDTNTTERVSGEFLALNSCGREVIANCDRGSRRMRGRMDYHLLYVERGICRLMLDGRETQIGEGGVILFRPGEPQVYHYRQSDRSVSHYIHFTGVGCERLLSQLGIGEIRVFMMGRSHSYEEISEKMVREYSMRSRFWECRCAGYLCELLSIIARKYALRETGVSRAGESRINAVCLRLYEDPIRPPSAAELAAECCLSESRFTHLFREVTGKSLTEFITGLRMERAKELLGASELSIAEIGETVGYEDANYFSRCFRNTVGCSPRDYRRQERE